MINTSKPTTSVTNSSKVSIGETWASITTTWATETRTWQQSSKLITNQLKRQFYLWSVSSFPWLETSPWNDSASNITNQTKPI